jgi:hypothetical protein
MMANEMLRLLAASKMLDEESTIDDLITAMVEILIEQKKDEYSELTKDLVRSVYGEQTFTDSKDSETDGRSSEKTIYLYHIVGPVLGKDKMKDLIAGQGLASHCARGNWVLKEGILHLIDGQRIYFHRDRPYVVKDTLLLRIKALASPGGSAGIEIVEPQTCTTSCFRSFPLKDSGGVLKSSVTSGTYIESRFPFTIPPWCIEFLSDSGAWSELAPVRNAAARSFSPQKRSLAQTMPPRIRMNIARLNIDPNDIEMMENYAILSYMANEDPSMSKVRLGNKQYAFLDICTPTDFKRAIKRIESEDRVPMTDWKTL